MQSRNIKIGYLICAVAGIILAFINLPFGVTYTNTNFIASTLQTHTISFLGSPLYTWTSWNGAVGPFEFFLAFILNTIVCAIAFTVIQKIMD